jgi:hypothetical protein
VFYINMPHFRTPPSQSTTDAASPSNPPITPAVIKITVKNRRKRYLDTHPTYFHSAHLELASPLLYDRLVRRFLTAAEREQLGRERGYTGNLEADLVRAEAKLDALRNAEQSAEVTYRRREDGEIVEMERGDEVMGKEEGWGRWVEVMGEKFVRGEDQDFDYTSVDENEDYDDRAEQDRTELEGYLDGQAAEFVGEGTPKGETGVQDF